MRAYKGIEVINLRQTEKRNILDTVPDLSAVLRGKGNVRYAIPHHVIFSLLMVQVRNDVNSLNHWPDELKESIMVYARPFIRDGNPAHAISRVTGIAGSTIYSWL